MTTHIAFDGGTKHGTTATYDLDDDSSLYFNTAFEPHELYRRTDERRIIDGVEHVVFQIAT